MNKNDEEIIKELRQIVASGDEQKTKDFLIKNFTKLPKNLQRGLVLSLIEGGLKDGVEDNIEEYDKKTSSFIELCKIIKENLNNEPETEEQKNNS